MQRRGIAEMVETIDRVERCASKANSGDGVRLEPCPAVDTDADIDVALRARDRMLRSAAVIGEQISGFAAARLRQSGDPRQAVRDGGPAMRPDHAPAVARRTLDDAQRLAELAARIMMISCVIHEAACARTAVGNTGGASGGAGRGSAQGPWRRPSEADWVSLTEGLHPRSRRVLRNRRGVAPRESNRPDGAEAGPP
jgi:hypothetical protein